MLFYPTGFVSWTDRLSPFPFRKEPVVQGKESRPSFVISIKGPRRLQWIFLPYVGELLRRSICCVNMVHGSGVESRGQDLN